MATMDLLSGGINGKLGNLYGSKMRRTKVIKAVPFSHAPHNHKQKEAFTAFGCLQRISAAIAAVFFDRLGIMAKGINKINAVSHLFKPIISNRVFELSKLVEIAPPDESIEIIYAEFDKNEQSFYVKIENTKETEELNAEATFVAFVQANGFCPFKTVIVGDGGEVYAPTKYTGTESLSCIAFKSVRRGHITVLKGYTSIPVSIIQ